MGQRTWRACGRWRDPAHQVGHPGTMIVLSVNRCTDAPSPYTLRVPAAPSIDRQLLGDCQPLDGASAIPAQRKARREYANRVKHPRGRHLKSGTVKTSDSNAGSLVLLLDHGVPLDLLYCWREMVISTMRYSRSAKPGSPEDLRLRAPINEDQRAHREAAAGGQGCDVVDGSLLLRQRPGHWVAALGAVHLGKLRHRRGSWPLTSRLRWRPASGCLGGRAGYGSNMSQSARQRDRTCLGGAAHWDGMCRRR